METMRISEVAARRGVPATTLRYYEDLGLLRPDRASNGYRRFDAETLERLRFITAAKQLHLSLEGIASLLPVWDSDPCADVKARLRPLLDDRLGQIDAAITELTEAGHDLAAATQHLDEIPDRVERCRPECAVLATAPGLPPVVCSLGSGRAGRVAKWRDVFAGAPTRPVPGGVRIELPAEALSRIGALAVAEQECCPFFGFEIALHGSRFILTVTAPPEAMAALGELFPGDENRSEPEASDRGW